jgi:hypothetical protein
MAIRAAKILDALNVRLRTLVGINRCRLFPVAQAHEANSRHEQTFPRKR